MNLKTKLLATAATLTLMGGGLAAGVMSAGAAQAKTETCNSCIHVQNVYAFRGALDALHQATAVNSPIGLWYENPSTTDPGADLLGVPVGAVTQNFATNNDATVNDSNLNWYPYVGDSVIRLKYDDYGNGQANDYIGLNGTLLALRNDNPNSRWQEFVEVPVNNAGVPDGCTASVFSSLSSSCTKGTGSSYTAGVPNACGALTGPTNTRGIHKCVLIDVGQTADPIDPIVVTDRGNAFTGSLVQQDVEFADVNQNGAYATDQMWEIQN